MLQLSIHNVYSYGPDKMCPTHVYFMCSFYRFFFCCLVCLLAGWLACFADFMVFFISFSFFIVLVQNQINIKMSTFLNFFSSDNRCLMQLNIVYCVQIGVCVCQCVYVCFFLFHSFNLFNPKVHFNEI